MIVYGRETGVQEYPTDARVDAAAVLVRCRCGQQVPLQFADLPDRLQCEVVCRGTWCPRCGSKLAPPPTEPTVLATVARDDEVNLLRQAAIYLDHSGLDESGQMLLTRIRAVLAGGRDPAVGGAGEGGGADAVHA